MGISVYVIDAERTFADALAARLEKENDVESVVPVQPGPQAAQVPDAQGGVVLIDADFPDGAAIGICGKLQERAGTARVIMLSQGSEATRIAEALGAGASAWVRKDESLDHLLAVIRGVVAGETWLPRTQTGAVFRLLLEEREKQREADRLLAALTPREREVLAYLSEGIGRRAMAEQLHVSANTIRTHLQNLMGKLGVHSTLEAVALTRGHLGAGAGGRSPRST